MSECFLKTTFISKSALEVGTSTWLYYLITDRHSPQGAANGLAVVSPSERPITGHLCVPKTSCLLAYLRFMIIEDGSVNADAFIEFIKRLLDVMSVPQPPHSRGGGREGGSR
jgi:hypothetical protein